MKAKQMVLPQSYTVPQKIIKNMPVNWLRWVSEVYTESVLQYI